MTLVEILTIALKKEASDVHLKSGLVPIIRKHGKLRPLRQGDAPLSGQEIEDMAMAILDDHQKKILADIKEVDVGYGVSGVGGFE